MGSSADFWVDASGELPLFCQWYFNDTHLLSYGTNCSLGLTNVQFAHTGNYTVVVTNAFGAVTSAPARLNVIQPVERRWVPGLTLRGQPGNTVNLAATSTLAPTPNWTTLGSVVLTNTSQWYFDLTAPRPPSRFYRTWQSNPLASAARLDLHLIPALTLTGNPGSRIRLEGINQFGPTDAWFTVAKVTLTSPSQLYFDVSVVGQPQRLWRLVPVP